MSGRRIGIGGWAILLLSVLFFALPLVMTAAFSFWEGGSRYGLDAYRKLAGSPELFEALELSIELALATVAALAILLVPAMIFMNLYAPRLRPVFEFVSTLPFVGSSFSPRSDTMEKIVGPGSDASPVSCFGAKAASIAKFGMTISYLRVKPVLSCTGCFAIFDSSDANELIGAS